jgi:hypothetical protein
MTRAQVVQDRAQVVHARTPPRNPPGARVGPCTTVHDRPMTEADLQRLITDAASILGWS